MSNPRWDETWHRLRDWTNGQGPSERLAAQVLLREGYEGIDPSHPLGGKDGGRDAICTKNDKRWVMAVYFPRGVHDFKEIERKFCKDLAGARANHAEGIAFVTNQEIHLAERKQLTIVASPILVDLFHVERLITILDSPPMADVRKQFLGIDHDDARNLVLGGEGGSAPGAGGGGGAALGLGASGGDGGRGGNIRLNGTPGEAPGSGGGGAGAIGEGTSGGEGGEGGEHVVGVFRAEDLPPKVQIKIGRGGRGGDGGDGEDGEDTCFGELLRAKGGKGGRAGRTQSSGRQVSAADLEKGLQVSSVYLANCVHIRGGLLDLLSAGWEHYEVPNLPFDAQWPLACTVSMGEIEPETLFELSAVVKDPTGTEVMQQRFTVSSGPPRVVAMANALTTLRFTASCAGVWSITISSGYVELARLPIEIKLGAR